MSHTIQHYRVASHTITSYPVTYIAHYGVATVSRIDLQVSFAGYSLLYRALLHKRPVIQSILLTEATPYRVRSCGSYHTWLVDVNMSPTIEHVLLCDLNTNADHDDYELWIFFLMFMSCEFIYDCEFWASNSMSHGKEPWTWLILFYALSSWSYINILYSHTRAHAIDGRASDRWYEWVMDMSHVTHMSTNHCYDDSQLWIQNSISQGKESWTWPWVTHSKARHGWAREWQLVWMSHGYASSHNTHEYVPWPWWLWGMIFFSDIHEL